MIAMSCQTQLSYACVLGLIDWVRFGHTYPTSSYSCMSPADRASCLLCAILVSFETEWLTLFARQSTLYERICAASQPFSISITLSRSIRDRSSLSTGPSVCAGAIIAPRLFFFPRPSSVFQANTTQTYSSSPGSALSPWPKLFGHTWTYVGLTQPCPQLPARVSLGMVWHPRCQIAQTNRNNVWCVWNCVKI
jgi:hypothetical protein